jgi:hypothetical protein
MPVLLSAVRSASEPAKINTSLLAKLHRQKIAGLRTQQEFPSAKNMCAKPASSIGNPTLPSSNIENPGNPWLIALVNYYLITKEATQVKTPIRPGY